MHRPPHFLRVARGCPIHWRRVSKDKKPGFSTLTAGFLPALVAGEWSWTKAEKGGFLRRRALRPLARRGFKFAADYNHTSPPDGEGLMPDPDL